MTTKVITKWNGDEVKVIGQKVISDSTYKIGLVVEGQAKELAARRYGYLAASINTQSKDKGDNIENPSNYAKETPPTNHNVESFRNITKPNNDNETLIGSAVDYAPYQEFGTVRMNAQPFLRPALDLAMGESLTIVEVEGKNQFKEYLK
jgi:HK97 gp10 family phage protein